MSSDGIFTKFKKALNTPIGSSGKSKKAGAKTTAARQRNTVAGEHSVIQEGIGKGGRFTAYLLVILLAAGAVCGALAFFRPAPAPTTVESGGIKAQQQEAATYGQQVVGAWLDASAEDHKALDNYVGDAGKNMSGKSASEYKDLAVASIDDSGDGVTSVKVTASIKGEAKGSNGNDTTTWTPYWYQIAVKEDGSKFSALGTPTPIAAPQSAGDQTLGYSNRVSDKDMTGAVQDFVSAYAAGQGDVNRYVSPGSSITAISPAYYEQAKVTDLSAQEKPKDGSPKNGETAKVMANVELSRGQTSKPTQYVLDLKARDGRWEIEKIASAPKLSE